MINETSKTGIQGFSQGYIGKLGKQIAINVESIYFPIFSLSELAIESDSLSESENRLLGRSITSSSSCLLRRSTLSRY